MASPALLSILKSLSITTYNVTRDTFGSNHRIPAILEALRTTESTIIVLQEVNYELLKKIRGCSWVQDRYFISDVAGRFFGQIGSGHLILSTLPFTSIKVMQLRSKTGNLAAVATFTAQSRTLGVASVQVFLSFPFPFNVFKINKVVSLYTSWTMELTKIRFGEIPFFSFFFFSFSLSFFLLRVWCSFPSFSLSRTAETSSC